MIWADLGRAALLSLIPLAALTGTLRLELLYLVAPLVGVLTVLFDVAYQSFVPALVRREQVMEANSRLATSDALAEITTPGLAGLLVQLITAPMAILIDAVSFVLSAVSVGLIRSPEPPAGGALARQHVFNEIREGLAVVFGSPVLRALAGFNATRSFFGNFIGPLYALYLLEDLQLGPVLLGVTIGVGGASNLLGTLIVAPLTRRFGVGPTMVAAALLGAVSPLLIPVASGPVMVAFTVLVVSQAMDFIHPLYDVNALSLRQTSAPERLLGRVNASMQVLEGGLGPIGAIAGGLLGSVLGVRATLFLAAAGIIASVVWLLFSPVPRIRAVASSPT